jgi:hypothetical protein
MLLSQEVDLSDRMSFPHPEGTRRGSSREQRNRRNTNASMVGNGSLVFQRVTMSLLEDCSTSGDQLHCTPSDIQRKPDPREQHIALSRAPLPLKYDRFRDQISGAWVATATGCTASATSQARGLSRGLRAHGYITERRDLQGVPTGLGPQTGPI